jgi:hypothetical protein
VATALNLGNSFRRMSPGSGDWEENVYNRKGCLKKCGNCTCYSMCCMRCEYVWKLKKRPRGGDVLDCPSCEVHNWLRGGL